MKKKIIIFLFFSALGTGLSTLFSNTSDSIIHIILDEIKDSYTPRSGEGRLSLSTSTSVSGDTILILGATTEKTAYVALQEKLDSVNNRYFINKVKLLPDASLNDTLYAIVNVSVADVRTQNRYTSGMATQTMLGTPVKILEKDNWFFIQMPDSYHGWIHGRQIEPMNKQQYNEWLAAPKIIFTKHYGFAYTDPDLHGETVSDLVSGNVLRLIGIEGDYFKVSYPDKRIGYVLREESKEYATWLNSREPSADNFIKVANSMKGIPYVWGGTSAKGVDCSGLISTVMKLHGLLILRDASQQATVGLPVDISSGYKNLKEGDLMFFGKAEDRSKNQKENIRHVGFYLGNNKFIHASDYTRVSSLDPKDKEYDEGNAKEFVKARRIIDGQNLYGVEKIVNNSFYQIQK